MEKATGDGSEEAPNGNSSNDIDLNDGGGVNIERQGEGAQQRAFITGTGGDTGSFLTPEQEPSTRARSRTASVKSRITVNDLGERLFQKVHCETSGRAPEVALPTSDKRPLVVRLCSLRCPQEARETEKQFFPWGSVEALITKQEVVDVLRAEPCLLQPDRAEYYASQICHPQRYGDNRLSHSGYRKIFAILVIIRRIDDILLFVEEKICDGHLPLEAKSTEHGQFEMRLRGKEEEKLNWLSHWDDTLGHEEFEEKQWTMLVPYFAKEEGHSARLWELSKKSILPWLPRSEGRQHEGGYSWVSKVEIHPHHHNFNQLQDCMVSGNFFAVKHLKAQFEDDAANSSLNLASGSVERVNGATPQIKLPTENTDTENIRDTQNIKSEFEHEIDTLNRLSHRPHAHLITLLAAYQLGNECYMIFPWAESDLKAMWQARQPSPPLEKRSMEWFLGQCLGLSQGLNHIHQSRPTPTPGEEEKMLGRIFGRHGDIKPENILYFWNSKDSTDRGKLVITDFGLTRFHGDKTKTYLRKNKPPATPTYRPPESDITSSPISQSYDIWSFGCVLLEFVTWYLGGWDLVKSFVKKRKLINPLMNNWHTDQFFEILQESESSDTVFSRVKKEIFEFVNELHSHPSCCDILHDMLEFIMKKMVISEMKVMSQTNSSRGVVSRVTVDLRGQKHSASDLNLMRAPCSDVVDEFHKLSQKLAKSPSMLKATPRPLQTVEIPPSVEIQGYPVGIRRAELPKNHGGKTVKVEDVLRSVSQQRKNTHP
ncbi:kinase-like domain-containing protein [Triangularia verruculosa]|uniref:Kinase-like domain-containing protein n=1 Tax=Triangularia verruculosa TaxID=2587418 RepID=A0AAN6XLN1_9PEZI|nr:kinase-like domain-containing protein [Triangularia verruculosa]